MKTTLATPQLKNIKNFQSNLLVWPPVEYEFEPSVLMRQDSNFNVKRSIIRIS